MQRASEATQSASVCRSAEVPAAPVPARTQAPECHCNPSRAALRLQIVGHERAIRTDNQRRRQSAHWSTRCKYEIRAFPTLVVAGPQGEPTILQGYAGKAETLKQLHAAAAAGR